MRRCKECKVVHLTDAEMNEFQQWRSLVLVNRHLEAVIRSGLTYYTRMPREWNTAAQDALKESESWGKK